MKHRFGRYVAVVSTVAMLGLGVGQSAFASTHASNGPRKGGTLNVLVVTSQWPGLDPATDTQDAADAAYLNAIFGQLFELTPGEAIVPDEASSYAFSNHNSTVTFTIRKGVKFSNGDPLTAADVAWSINRDLEPQYGNIGDVNFPLTSAGATASGNKVIMNMTQPDTGIIYAFISEAPNWTVDENALNTEGEATYAQTPIGAGPFTVTSNSASASLVLAKNPHYWNAPEPYLSGLTFTNVGTDQSAISALQSGEDQMATGVTTIPLLQQVTSEGLKLTKLPELVDEFIALNTTHAPFNNVMAREAVQEATNAKALVEELYGNEYTTVQSETAPGQEYYQKTNKYYTPYNLAGAEALVKQLGGLTTSLSTTTNSAFWINEVQAIATQWEAAGITVNIQDYTLQQMLNITFNNTWQAIDENWGPSVDPAINDGQFFRSHVAFSGVVDGTLDGYLNQSEGFVSPTKEAQIFGELANYENQQHYAVWMYAKRGFIVSTNTVVPNGGFASNQVNVAWERIYLKG